MAEVETLSPQVANPNVEAATSLPALRPTHLEDQRTTEQVDTPPSAMKMAETQQSPPLLHASTSSPAQPPGHLPTQQWFQSSPPRIDPTTGCTYMVAFPVQMQRMVAELTDQAE